MKYLRYKSLIANLLATFEQIRPNEECAKIQAISIVSLRKLCKDSLLTTSIVFQRKP